MTIIHLPAKNNDKYVKEIKTLITQSDKEFIPALSSLSSTTQQTLTPSTANNSCDAYFAATLNQNILLALDANDNVLGFMSYRENYTCPHIDKETFNNLYVTTVITHIQSRKRGVASAFYQYLKDLYPEHEIFTRTWSTNISHSKILCAQDFVVHAVLPNDRGEGIDTVYFRYTP